MRLAPRLSWLPSYGGLLALACACIACDRREALQGEAPPPLASAAPGLCERESQLRLDPATASFFPRRVAGYCLDPNGEVVAYGKEANRDLDALCIELLDGECELYIAHGLDRAVALRYVSGEGTPAFVSVTLTRYTSSEGAFGFYTKRVVAGDDPARHAPAPLEAGGAAALGSGIAYVWRGPYVAELAYSNQLESPEQLKASARQILALLAKSIGDHIAAPTEWPRAARALPVQHRVASGISYELRDVLGVQGTGAAAHGYYARDGKRWRVVIFAQPEEESTKDLVGTFRKSRGYQKWKDPLPAFDSPFRFNAVLGDVATSWFFARQGELLVGVGDEPLVLTPAMANSQREGLTLTDEAKQRELLAVLRAQRRQ